MKHTLIWKLESLYAFLLFLVEHAFISTDITDLAADKTGLETAIAEIETAKGVQDTNIKGVAQVTKDKKRKMAATVIAKASKARPKARDVENWELFDQLNYDKTYIFGASKLNAVSRAKDIQKVIVDNPTLFDNITAADKTAMTSAINDYNSVKLAPRAKRSEKKTGGTDAYKKSFKKAQKHADNMYDYIYGQYELDNPGLITSMDLALDIEEEGVRHNTLRVTFIDGNPPEGAITAFVEKAQVLIAELGKKALSDINGVANLMKFLQGTYHVEFSAAGFVTQTMIVHFGQGQTVELEVVLMRVAS